MIPLPIPMGMGGGKKIADIKGFLGDISHVLIYLEWFVVFLFIGVLIYLGFKIFYKLYFTRRLKKVLILLHRLYTELFLIKNISKIKDVKKLDIELSCKETLSRLQKLVESRFFIKKLGEHNVQRVRDGLEMMIDKSIDVNIQMELVQNWIQMLKNILTV